MCQGIGERQLPDSARLRRCPSGGLKPPAGGWGMRTAGLSSAAGTFLISQPYMLHPPVVASSGSKPFGQAHTKSKGRRPASRTQLCTMLLPSPTYTTCAGIRGRGHQPSPGRPMAGTCPTGGGAGQRGNTMQEAVVRSRQLPQPCSIWFHPVGRRLGHVGSSDGILHAGGGYRPQLPRPVRPGFARSGAPCTGSTSREQGGSKPSQGRMQQQSTAAGAPCLLALDGAELLVDGECVGHDLAGVVVVRQPVDDGAAAVLCQLQQVLILRRQEGSVARHRWIVDGRMDRRFGALVSDKKSDVIRQTQRLAASPMACHRTADVACKNCLFLWSLAKNLLRSSRFWHGTWCGLVMPTCQQVLAWNMVWIGEAHVRRNFFRVL